MEIRILKNDKKKKNTSLLDWYVLVASSHANQSELQINALLKVFREKVLNYLSFKIFDIIEISYCLRNGTGLTGFVLIICQIITLTMSGYREI